MLAKKYRLKKYSAVIATYKNNDVISDKRVCIYFGRKKIDCDTDTKYAFVVSKKVDKRAVVRNRIKRYMREVIKKILKENKYPDLNKYMSLVISGKSMSAESAYSDIEASILEILTRRANKG